MPTIIRALLLSIVLAGCSPSDSTAANRSTANIANTLDTSVPKGWHYTAPVDRIGNERRRLAALVNEDSDPLLDNSVVLGIQLSDGGTSVFFRSVEGSFRCFTTCGIRFRADGETGMWTGEGSDGDVIVLNHSEAALRSILTSSNLIVELSPNGQERQYTFRVAGLRWPQP